MKIKWKNLPLPSSIPKAKSYLSMFGMHEMEKAAKRIVYICQQNQETWKEAAFHISSFIGDEERTGFVYLVAYKWLKEAYETGWFRPTKGFVQRICYGQYDIIEVLRWYQQQVIYHPLTCGEMSSHGKLEPKIINSMVVMQCPECGWIQTLKTVPLIIFDLYKNK